MSKHHHLWKQFRRASPWYFLTAALVSGAVCIFALRANNEHMIKLRDAVYSADQKNGDIEAALKNLQTYVTGHMNTNLNAGSTAVYPPIQLKYTYERLVRSQSDQIARGNTTLYSAAQTACEQQNHSDFSGRNRVPCIEQYVLSHNPEKTAPIPDGLYKFAFITPRWTPDLAGWSLVAALLSGLLFVISLATRLLHRPGNK